MHIQAAVSKHNYRKAYNEALYGPAAKVATKALVAKDSGVKKAGGAKLRTVLRIRGRRIEVVQRPALTLKLRLWNEPKLTLKLRGLKTAAEEEQREERGYEADDSDVEDEVLEM
jgi:hypothetical protein